LPEDWVFRQKDAAGIDSGSVKENRRQPLGTAMNNSSDSPIPVVFLV
jgi:hypothetical protein